MRNLNKIFFLSPQVTANCLGLWNKKKKEIVILMQL